jgi:hypothetical protein
VDNDVWNDQKTADLNMDDIAHAAVAVFTEVCHHKHNDTYL